MAAMLVASGLMGIGLSNILLIIGVILIFLIYLFSGLNCVKLECGTFYIALFMFLIVLKNAGGGAISGLTGGLL